MSLKSSIKALSALIIVCHSRWLACISNSKIMLSYGNVKYIFPILFYFCFSSPCMYLFISLGYILRCTNSNSCEGHFKCLWMTIDNSMLTLLFKLNASLALIICEHIENLVLLYFHKWVIIWNWMSPIKYKIVLTYFCLKTKQAVTMFHAFSRSPPPPERRLVF